MMYDREVRLKFGRLTGSHISQLECSACVYEAERKPYVIARDASDGELLLR
jgi:hypothetical protein